MRHRLRPLDAPDKADDLRAQQRITIGYGQLWPYNYIRLPLSAFNGPQFAGGIVLVDWKF